MIEVIKVVDLKVGQSHTLHLEFSNGDKGVADFSWVHDIDGAMIEPLKNQEFFAKAFISMGVPTWPNGYSVDAINLHRELKEKGQLHQSAA